MGAVIASVTSVVTVWASTTEPDAVKVPDADIVSPGFAGFMTVFLIAVATVLLIRSMTKHMRKAKFMADEMERLEQLGQLDEAGRVPSAPRPGQSAAGRPAAGQDPAPDSAAQAPGQR